MQKDELKKPMQCDVSLDWCDYSCPCGASICTRHLRDGQLGQWLADHKPHTTGQVIEHVNADVPRCLGVPLPDVTRNL